MLRMKFYQFTVKCRAFTIPLSLLLKDAVFSYRVTLE